MLTLRAARPDDAQTIHQLIYELAVYEKLEQHVDATADDIAAALFGATPRVYCDIADWRDANGTRSVGFALWFYNFSTFRGRHGIYLEDLFVRPEFRGHGIGKALLVQLAQRCLRERLARLEWAVLDWNEPSRAFYRSLGAKEISEWVVNRVSGAELEALAAQATR